MCQLTILSTVGETVVGYCFKCQKHYVWQNSFLLTFSAFQFESFASDIEAKNGGKEYFSFPDGIKRTFLETPIQEVLLTFTEGEWFDFGKAIQDSFYMRDIYNLINKDIKS